MTRPLIALSGLWVPVSVLTYLWRALRGGADILRVGPWLRDGAWQPWETQDGAGGLPTSLRVPQPDLCVDQGTGLVSSRRDNPLLARARAEGVDLWLDVDGGWSWTGDTPVRFQRRELVITDPHVRGWRSEVYLDMRARVGRVWQMQSGPWMQDGDRLLPYAYDRDWHFPLADVREMFQVSLIGQPYEERRELGRRLRRAGLHVLGPGVVGVGLEYTEALCRAPVAIVWPLADDLPARVFEAAACRRGIITKPVRDLEMLLPALDRTPGLRLCRTLDAVVETAVNEIEALRREARAPGCFRALTVGHSWHDRAQRLLTG